MRATLTVVACLALLGVAAAVLYWIYTTEPAAERVAATKQTAMLVEVLEARRGDHRPTIVAQGEVMAARDVMLAPRVGGEVVERSPLFEPGGFVAKGDLLLRLDPDDYEIVLEQRRADLAQAEADLAVEMGRQAVAREDYRLLGEDLASENEALVLREPQLRTARANVDAAKAAVRQAELDLERTRIVAPFDAHVLTRAVDVGSQVAAGEPLGRIVGLDEYWVVATVPLAKLRWIDLPEGDAPGAAVRVHDPAAWAPGETRAGTVQRLIGTLDEETRMARLLVTVDDPLGRAADAPGNGGEGPPPLMLDAYVEARIEGRLIEDVVRLERAHLRRGDTLWIMEEGELRIRDADVAFRDARWAYVRGGVEEGERVVTTDLSTVVEGAPLRRAADGEEDGAFGSGE